MTIPKIQHPTFELTIPSNETKIKCRQMLVKEEKILLFAKASGDLADILAAVKQVLTLCIVSPTQLDVNSLASFDIDYLFVKLRALSVDSMTKVSYKDSEDEKQYDFEIDFNSLKVEFPKDVTKVVPIDMNTRLSLKYPEARIYEDKEYIKMNDTDRLNASIVKCFDKYYSGDEVVDLKNETEEDLKTFLENLDLKTYDKLIDFVSNLPKMNYVIEYTNSKGTKRTIVFDSLNDFFPLV